MGRAKPPLDDTEDASDRQRLDKWIVYARFVKTRSVALELIGKGRVRLNGSRETKPDRKLAIDDVLTLALPHATEVVRVLSLAEMRGSASDAGELYERIDSTPTIKSSDDRAWKDKHSHSSRSFSKNRR
ncbi:MAG: RNA-binding S4 domain-containing protein [Hyphomicrobiales bacterium]|nr:RNA-binding S4 domain-containing protein [Hyphomicrobiales bacterium]